MTIAWVVPLAAATVGAAVAVARRAERARSASLMAALADVGPDVGQVDRRVADVDLPAPVQRFFACSLRPGQPRIRCAQFRQIGLLRTGVESDRWMRFSATHTVEPPSFGFVWNARVRLGAGLHLDVRDALVRGEGSGRAAFMSVVPLASAHDDARLTAGALHRYLAEAPWYPTALLPSAALRWSPVDARRALATLTAHGTTVALEFRFGADGAVTAIHTPARWGRFGSGYEERPWEGRFGPSVERDGMRVPSEGQVGWYVDDAWRCVWAGRIVASSFTFGA